MQLAIHLNYRKMMNAIDTILISNSDILNALSKDFE